MDGQVMALPGIEVEVFFWLAGYRRMKFQTMAIESGSLIPFRIVPVLRAKDGRPVCLIPPCTCHAPDHLRNPREVYPTPECRAQQPACVRRSLRGRRSVVPSIAQGQVWVESRPRTKKVPAVPRGDPRIASQAGGKEADKETAASA